MILWMDRYNILTFRKYWSSLNKRWPVWSVAVVLFATFVSIFFPPFSVLGIFSRRCITFLLHLPLNVEVRHKLFAFQSRLGGPNNAGLGNFWRLYCAQRQVTFTLNKKGIYQLVLNPIITIKIRVSLVQFYLDFFLNCVPSCLGKILDRQSCLCKQTEKYKRIRRV